MARARRRPRIPRPHPPGDRSEPARSTGRGRPDGYSGFDPTADSLHVGHLLQLCNLRRLQQAGHRPIAVAGGGDRSHRRPGREDRGAQPALAPNRSQANLEGIRPQLERFLDFGGPQGARSWSTTPTGCEPVTLFDFLRDVGKHFTVNQMVAKDSVRSRLERGPTGHLLHRVQLHAPAGRRLPPPVRRLRLPAPAGWQRPVGEHHHRHRAHPQGPPGDGLGPHHAAGAQGGRHQVRQDRVGDRLARRRGEPARTSSTSSSCAPRTRWSAPTYATSPSFPRAHPRARPDRRPSTRTGGRPSGRWPTRWSSSSTGRWQPPGPRRRRPPCSAARWPSSTRSPCSTCSPTCPPPRWSAPAGRWRPLGRPAGRDGPRSLQEPWPHDRRAGRGLRQRWARDRRRSGHRARRSPRRRLRGAAPGPERLPLRTFRLMGCPGKGTVHLGYA